MADFSDIYPYDDAQTRKALKRVARHPFSFVISRYLFPDKPCWTLSRALRKVRGVDEFQSRVMMKVVKSILDRTSDGLEIRGMDNLGSGRKLFISNHRDIVMDPAILLYSLGQAGPIQTDLCVGSNLLSSRYVEDMMRSNALVKVYRGLPPHEMVEFSHTLSSYVRGRICSGNASVWIAQRQGRAKDGCDRTGQGILKMLDMSGMGDFAKDFIQLCISPVSISYQYESCDALRARELLLSRQGPYVKKKGEDTHSIKTGITQKKGRICISFCKPLGSDEIASAADLKGNERYKALCSLIDSRVISSYRLWNTNYMGYDLMHGSDKYLGVEYSEIELIDFKKYTDCQLKKVCNGLDLEELRRIFYSIYGNPVESVLSLQ